MIDNTLTYQTPEGTELSIETASVILRAYAWIIDAIIRIVILTVANLVLFSFLEAGFGLFMLIGFFVVWLYPVVFEVLNDGQTFGKKLMGIYVCMDNGMPVGWQASMIRNLLMFADFLPFAFCFGVLCSLFSTSNKRLGDVMAGTIVAYIPKNQTLPSIKKTNAKNPPIALTFKEQTAILAFAERYDSLPPARRAELANILAKMTKGGDEVILGYANAILGNDAQTKGR